MVSIEYTLEEAGWAVATIGNGETTVNMTVSYLHDTLKQLAESALDVDTAKSKRVVFMDEPGEHHLILAEVSDTDIEFELRWYEDWTDWNAIEDEKYKTVLRGKTKKTNYVNQVRAILINIMETMGVEGYHEKWVNHEFPRDAYRRLV